MKNTLTWLSIVLLLVAGIALLAYSRLAKEPPPVVYTPPPAPLVQEPPVPRIAYPVPPPQPIRVDGREIAPPPLPKLDDSDQALEPALIDLLGQQTLIGQLVLKDFIRRVVVTVDNLPREQVPQRFLPVQPVGGPLRAAGEEDERFLSSENFQRYRRHVGLFEELDGQQLVNAYFRFYPLFQEAYEELGYPDGYFNDRLVAVIDHMLAAPEIEGPIRLVQPSVMYRYADPKLEAMSAGHKMLLRMGPDHAARVKHKLRELRQALLAQVQGH